MESGIKVRPPFVDATAATGGTILRAARMALRSGRYVRSTGAERSRRVKRYLLPLLLGLGSELLWRHSLGHIP